MFETQMTNFCFVSHPTGAACRQLFMLKEDVDEAAFLDNSVAEPGARGREGNPARFLF